MSWGDEKPLKGFHCETARLTHTLQADDGSGSMEGSIKFCGEKLEAVRLGKRMGNRIMVEAERLSKSAEATFKGISC